MTEASNQKSAASTWPKVALHLVGMAVVAMANPLIYYGGGLYQWFITLSAAWLLPALLFSFGWLFFSRRMRQSGAKPFLILAWVLLAVVLVQAWALPKAPPAAEISQEQWERGVMTAPTK